ncbi:MAG: hypothetical protein CSA83_00535 [Actinomycetales bacterium]|nr:MAG: hypothetical protein CSA83_00535 [Actinomycetales bacterium]
MPTAIVAANDELALGLMKALAERGITVPEDVSVTGFDDVPSSAYFPSALTTIRQDFAALGREVLGLAVTAIQTGETPESKVLPVHFVPRASTAAPRTHPLLSSK